METVNTAKERECQQLLEEKTRRSLQLESDQEYTAQVVAAAREAEERAKAAQLNTEGRG